jgi:two-component system OmpR family response regulator
MFDRSIDIQVSRLRRKIEPDPRDPPWIKTVRYGGYVFTPEVAMAHLLSQDGEAAAEMHASSG